MFTPGISIRQRKYSLMYMLNVYLQPMLLYSHTVACTGQWPQCICILHIYIRKAYSAVCFYTANKQKIAGACHPDGVQKDALLVSFGSVGTYGYVCCMHRDLSSCIC